MIPKIRGRKAPPYASGSSSRGCGASRFGKSPPKVDQLISDVAGLSIDTPQDNGWEVFSKKNEEELCETVCDREIVWPPMVLVRYHEKDVNEKVDKDDIEKLIGWAIMAKLSYGPLGLVHYSHGYNEVEARYGHKGTSLLIYSHGYNAVEARYGHKGTSLLIFENSAIGYVEAERLHKHFADKGTDRDAWDHCKLLEGTHHPYYGYMANKEDLDIFNQHCQGGTEVKFEMRSHHEMVVIPMDGADQHLFCLYSGAVNKEKNAKACQEYHGKSAEMLREAMEENRTVRQRTKMQHEQNKEEVHCELAEILDEELPETVCDREIVWPPMVLVRYHEKDVKDDNEKLIGRGNRNRLLSKKRNRNLPDFNAVAKLSYVSLGLVHYSRGYNAVEARYGLKGTSLLIFENSAVGYVEAERLHKHFADRGTDRDAWDHCKLIDETRHQFYGYMANKEDLDIFNQHCHGGNEVEFEMRSHHEMVVIPMGGNDQHLFWLYSRAVKGEKDAKAGQQNYGKSVEMLRETLEEDRIVRQTTEVQHEQNKEESIVDSSAANEELRQEEISKFILT